MPKKKRIALLHASGYDFPFGNQKALNIWAKQLDEFSIIADIHPLLVSVPAHPHNGGFISRIARRIVREWNKYDGFIVLLDQRSFIFVNHLLSMMLGNIGKPVLCITSLYTVDYTKQTKQQYNFIDMDLRTHILNAVQISTLDVSGVVVPLEGLIIPAEYCVQDPTSKQFHIRSRDGEEYGWFDFGVQVCSNIPKRSRNCPSNKNIIDFSTLYFVDAEYQQHISIPRGAKNIIIYSTQSLPLSIMSVLPSKATALLVGSDALYIYSNGQILPLEHAEHPQAIAAWFSWQSTQNELTGAQLVEALHAPR